MSVSGRVLRWTPILFHQNLESFHPLLVRNGWTVCMRFLKISCTYQWARQNSNPQLQPLSCLVGWFVQVDLNAEEFLQVVNTEQTGCHPCFFGNRLFEKVAGLYGYSMIFLTKIASWTSNGIGMNWSDFERYPLLELRVYWNCFRQVVSGYLDQAFVPYESFPSKFPLKVEQPKQNQGKKRSLPIL